MGENKILAFYKYVRIDNPDKFRNDLFVFCQGNELKGRILVAKEGINGSVAGNKKQTEKFKKHIQSDKRFKNIEFKEDDCIKIPFNKLVIKIKKEIVNFGKKVNLNKNGKHISGKEFLSLYKDKDTIILDARNNYESKVGRFKNAVTLDIGTFREFPKIIDQLKDKKEKNIVMYCTGGIRCEKASAFLIQNGFNSVYQLQGGILKFGKEFPDTVWEGKCFVFDKRLLTSINNKKNDIAECEICFGDCEFYRNCKNKDCNKFTVLCSDCKKNMFGCCSKKCFNRNMEYLKEKEIRNRGKSKNSIALNSICVGQN